VVAVVATEGAKMADFVPGTVTHTVQNFCRRQGFSKRTLWHVWKRDRVDAVISPDVVRFHTTWQCVEFGGGKAIARVRSYYSYQWVGEGPAHDICGYCGHDNGLHSEGRYGFDCGSCGGN
jgi:hypothetical protein